MKLFHATVFASIATSVFAGCSQIAGNYYCSETSKVIYEGIGFSGSYQDVTNMDETTGQCTQQSYSFSGNMSPLDEELSVHFRGPIKLLQFGVYYPSSSNSKREQEEVVEKRDEDCVQHVHHAHKRATAIEFETQTIFVNGAGQTVTGAAPGAAPTSVSAPASAPVASAPASAPASAAASSSSSSSAAASSSSASASSNSPSPSGGAYERSSYFTPGSADNCVFMNYFGGSGSGTWSAAFGNSLSFANSDATGGSSTPQALGDVTVASNNEYVIFSGSQCSGSDCGYYRSGTPAYHGFGGADKIFVFEFEMPTGSSSYNDDMPAVWLLNAKIPRTLQYGNADCSCWATGCGELDLFEVLSTGSSYMVSHLHDGQGASGNNGGGGSSDYFSRPTSGSFKAAVVFTGNQIHILEVTEDFGESLSQSTVDAWIAQEGSIATIGY